MGFQWEAARMQSEINSLKAEMEKEKSSQPSKLGQALNRIGMATTLLAPGFPLKLIGVGISLASNFVWRQAIFTHLNIYNSLKQNYYPPTECHRISYWISQFRGTAYSQEASYYFKSPVYCILTFKQEPTFVMNKAITKVISACFLCIFVKNVCTDC